MGEAANLPFINISVVRDELIAEALTIGGSEYKVMFVSLGFSNGGTFTAVSDVNPLPISGGGGGGGAVTIANGADVALGSTTDVAVLGDNNGTVSAKLRGLDKILNDVWDSTAHAVKTEVTAALQVAPVSLFDMTTRQAGVTQKALIFPTTVLCTLPSVGAGTAANITNSGNVCGGAFAPGNTWDSVLLDFACRGQNAADTLTVEIGRIKANGAIAEILASVVLTSSATTLAVSVNPFTGVAHSAATWRFFDVTAITSNSALGDVLQALGGSSGNLSQLLLNVRPAQFYYVVITAFSDGGTRTSEVICTMTPQS